ncbi:aminoacyl-tRNA hydrolase [Metamycoplasma phocicerebrale]|uniref:Peptidyl-tRNA hydrolase n=1 Tax=Metamycoplasma phocicerebrale TaxID=142649 RepID=A0A3T0TUI4_9BACT|nr:aminoacyl-tRNA hydrolase [Metamycoplasma phocicerebrale]AZZ65694.1 aminoacyl-tRNA hydrolase [Metamycoplasma phocicerebrale]
MKLIVGLGNPGKEYEKTRHNVGFMVLDKLSQKLKAPMTIKKFNGIYFKDKEMILAKPLTYMNNSGEFVKDIVDYYNINVDDILLVYDDIDTELGKIIIRQQGSAGGHNGVKSIINNLDTNEIKRIKMGIGRDENLINFVLGKFSFEDSKIIEKAIDEVVEAIIQYINNDIRYVMNKYSNKKYGEQ